MIAVLIGCVSLLYATVGQAGGTAFLAIMSFAGFPAGELRPTALILNIIAAGYGTWRMDSEGRIDRKLLVRMTAPSLLTAFAGGLIVLEGSTYFLLTGCLLLAAAALMVFRRTADTLTRQRMELIPACVVGGGAGFLSGITGVGGGVFLAPTLIAFGWASPKEAAGVSAPFILCNSITGIVGVFVSGQRVADGVALYAAAALLGAVLGSWIGLRWISQQGIRYMLAFILLIAGCRMLFR